MWLHPLEGQADSRDRPRRVVLVVQEREARRQDAFDQYSEFTEPSYSLQPHATQRRQSSE